MQRPSHFGISRWLHGIVFPSSKCLTIASSGPASFESVRSAGAIGNLETISKVLVLVEVAPVKLQNLSHWRAGLLGAGLLFGAPSPAAWAADPGCPPFPSDTDVFAYACSQTSNFGDGVAIQISGGKGTVSTSGLTGINTSPLGGSTAAQTFQNGQFGLTGNSGKIATTETEPASNPAGGSGTATATAGMGDGFIASFTGVPLANGNTAVSLQRVLSRVVIPTMHASASGSATGGPGGGISTDSSATDEFSDILSITQAQLNAVNKQIGGNYADIFVKLKYFVAGVVTANNHGDADGDFEATVEGASGVLVGAVGGEASASPTGDTDNLLGQMFALQFSIAPGNSVLLDAELDVEGTASSPFPGAPGFYIANLSDTAQFLGVSFYADAAETIPLPDIQLGSALGFDYIPADAILSPVGAAGAVPETSTWVMMLAGFCGLGALGFRRAAPRPARA
jgi:hypothetical protein